MDTLNKINEKIGRYRWRICALVFFATTINYLDRNVLGLLKMTLTEELQWTETDFAHIVMVFQMAYAVGLLGIGGIIDKIGTKAGYAVSLLGWSFAAMGHALARSTFGFGVARAALGVTEAGNFPAANKAVAEWFPKKERAFATGIYNSGCNIGAIVAPLSVPFIAEQWGWQWAFIITGAIGLIWIIFWYMSYSSPEKKLEKGILSQAEYDYIHSDKDEAYEDTPQTEKERVTWFKLFKYRQTWSFFFGKFLTDPIWWFYMFWLPSFLDGENARKLEAFKALYPNGAPEGVEPGVISWPFAVAVVYTISTIGSIFGGWLPEHFINKGMNANKARKLSMFIYALLPISVLLAHTLGQIHTWYAVAVISIGCAAHQAWSANIYTTVSDMFPKKAVASVSGIGGMAGAVGGMLIAWGTGILLDHFKALGEIETGYGIIFVVCALAYIIAWCLMHLLVPKFKQITDL